MQGQDSGSGMCAVSPVVDERELGWPFRLANDFVECSKIGLLGRVPRSEAPLTGFFQSEAACAHVLAGPIFCEHPMPERDQQDLAVRLVARCTAALAVVRVGGSWDAFRCTACGGARRTRESSCERCGAPAVPVHQNRYRYWLQYCDLQVSGADEHKWSWTSRALHDRRRRVLAWDDDYWCAPWDPMPEIRWDSPWHLKRWMRPHITINSPVVRAFLGRPPGPATLATARRVETRVSERILLLRVDPARLKKALKSVEARAFHKAARTSCAPGVFR